MRSPSPSPTPAPVAWPRGIILGLIWVNVGSFRRRTLLRLLRAVLRGWSLYTGERPDEHRLTQYLDPVVLTWAAEDPNGRAVQQGAEAYPPSPCGSGSRPPAARSSRAHGIVHDKDEREVWSDTESALVIEPARSPARGHQSASRKSAPLDRLALGVGVEPQYVE